jgi:lipoprotein-anchoring transpeptidase ErfK/SrfK
MPESDNRRGESGSLKNSATVFRRSKNLDAAAVQALLLSCCVKAGTASLRPGGNLAAAGPKGPNRRKTASLARSEMAESGLRKGICLECAAIFRHLPLTIRWRLLAIQGWGYTRAMMTKRILTICAALSAALAAEAVGTSLASAQGYPVPPGAVYSPSPQPYYPRGGYPADYRAAPRPMDFDALDDEDGPNGPGSAALPPPGPMVSPNDPRYGRPVYSDRGPVMSPDDPRYGRPAGLPPPNYSGPVMSPDDPRYGRPAGLPPPNYSGPVMSPDDPRYGRRDPPPVIYGDRPPGAPPAYGDSRIPGSGIVYPGDEDRGGIRPPTGVGQPGNVTGSVQQPGQPPQGVAPDGRPMVLSALPPEEQPESAPANLAPNLRRQEVNFATKEPAGTLIVDTPNTYLYYVLGNNRAIRYGVRVGRDGFTWTGVQKISRKAEWPDWHPPPEMIDRQPYLPRFMAGGPGNPLGARAMYLGNTVYRIHGTNQPSTIGKFVSSGCIGMLNEDVSDLFDRVKVGTRVVVMPGGSPPASTTTASAAPVPGPGAGPAMAPPPGVPGAPPTAVPPLPPPVTVR